MFESDPQVTATNRCAALFLDYGADSQSCDDGLELSERGMKFHSRWHFDIGTQLAIACVQHHPRLGARRVTVEGIVVWCETVSIGGQKTFETTLLFLELPDELRQSLREFSFALAPLAGS